MPPCYDLTTVALTGQTDLEDDVRAYGMAKSGLIERQFMLSLVQTAEGLPTALLERLKRIQQQSVETNDGTTLTGLTETTPAQKSLFVALDLTPPTPSDLAKPVL